jgi:hypothetical protein
MMVFGGRSKDWSRVLAGLALIAPAAVVARAETYLTEDQVAALLFPGVKLAPQWTELTAEQIKTIQKASGERVLKPRVRVWWGPQKQALFIDEVVGKHEFITYAVAVASDGAVQGVEIMDYKETYGYEVRRPQWRKQFVGKTSKSPLKLEKDIQNISGATLSSAHVTNGVRRVLQTYEILKDKV